MTRILSVLLVLAAALVALAALGARTLPARSGSPVEELTIEHTVLTPGTIELTMRNSRPDPVRVAQVFVNDSYVDFTGADGPIDRLGSATMSLRYPWQPGQPYHVSLLTSTGAVIEYDIASAAETPATDGRLLGLMVVVPPGSPGRRVPAATASEATSVARSAPASAARSAASA